MASWQDGPEYAPTERPAAFVTPPLPPLAAPVPPPAVTAPAEPGEPSFVPAAGPQPDLATLVPDAAPGRNPNMAFEVTAAAITAGGSLPAGPGTPGGRLPTQPFTSSGPPLTGYLPVQAAVQPNAQVNPAPFPAPNTPQWFAPPPESRVPVAPPPVTVNQIWLAATPAVMITLILGALFSWLSILMLFVSFALSARIAYRRAAVRRSYTVALAFAGFVGLISIVSGSYDADAVFSALSGGAQFVCWILPIVIGLIVGAAIRAGERPDRVG
ncbi:MAG: hypothetical protein LCH96_04665 [Actinobacteria bacterium]|nr:hypothetical protein [Actinomycetota bacterium]